jgi:hypothetical protein
MDKQIEERGGTSDCLVKNLCLLFASENKETFRVGYLFTKKKPFFTISVLRADIVLICSVDLDNAE